MFFLNGYIHIIHIYGVQRDITLLYTIQSRVNISLNHRSSLWWRPSYWLPFLDLPPTFPSLLPFFLHKISWSPGWHLIPYIAEDNIILNIQLQLSLLPLLKCWGFRYALVCLAGCAESSKSLFLAFGSTPSMITSLSHPTAQWMLHVCLLTSCLLTSMLIPSAPSYTLSITSIKSTKDGFHTYVFTYPSPRKYLE